MPTVTMNIFDASSGTTVYPTEAQVPNIDLLISEIDGWTVANNVSFSDSLFHTIVGAPVNPTVMSIFDASPGVIVYKDFASVPDRGLILDSSTLTAAVAYAFVDSDTWTIIGAPVSPTVLTAPDIVATVEALLETISGTSTSTSTVTESDSASAVDSTVLSFILNALLIVSDTAATVEVLNMFVGVTVVIDFSVLSDAVSAALALQNVVLDAAAAVDLTAPVLLTSVQQDFDMALAQDFVARSFNITYAESDTIVTTDVIIQVATLSQLAQSIADAVASVDSTDNIVLSLGISLADIIALADSISVVPTVTLSPPTDTIQSDQLDLVSYLVGPVTSILDTASSADSAVIFLGAVFTLVAADTITTAETHAYSISQQIIEQDLLVTVDSIVRQVLFNLNIPDNPAAVTTLAQAVALTLGVTADTQISSDLLVQVVVVTAVNLIIADAVASGDTALVRPTALVSGSDASSWVETLVRVTLLASGITDATVTVDQIVEIIVSVVRLLVVADTQTTSDNYQAVINALTTDLDISTVHDAVVASLSNIGLSVADATSVIDAVLQLVPTIVPPTRKLTIRKQLIESVILRALIQENEEEDP